MESTWTNKKLTRFSLLLCMVSFTQVSPFHFVMTPRRSILSVRLGVLPLSTVNADASRRLPSLVFSPVENASGDVIQHWDMQFINYCNRENGASRSTGTATPPFEGHTFPSIENPWSKRLVEVGQGISESMQGTMTGNRNAKEQKNADTSSRWPC